MLTVTYSAMTDSLRKDTIYSAMTDSLRKDTI